MLRDLKLLLGISDNSLDEKLEWILEATEKRLSMLLGGEDVPESLRYIITEVSVIRFNKIGSEGLSSHGVEGESLTFAANDFDGYMDEIQAYLNKESCATEGGGFRFL